MTDLPPFLRGDVEVGYTYDRLAGTLKERTTDGDVDVAQRQISAHNIAYKATFGAAPGTAVYVGIPHTVLKQVSFQDWSAMVYDPATEAGSYTGTATEADLTVSEGSGIEGVWIGVRGTPFSQAFTTRHNRFTLLLDGAIRTPSANANWYTVTEKTAVEGLPGLRGVGEGGVGLRILAAASTTFGRSEPYLVFSWDDTLPVEVDVKGNDGSVDIANAELDAGGHFELRIGTELLAGANEASGSRTSIDLHLVTAYTGASTVPTGIELPDVLVPGILVQSAESLEAGAGLSFNLRFFRNLEVDLWGQGRFRLPHRLESAYPIYSGADTVHVLAGANMVIRIR